MFHVKLGERDARNCFTWNYLSLASCCAAAYVFDVRQSDPFSAVLRYHFLVISLARYSALLGQPALRSAIIASVLGRLPIGITGLAILMLAQDTTRSFGTGGAVAACYVAGLAVVAPLLGRLIDRYGPKATLLGCAFAFPSALAGLVAALSAPAPMWLAFTLAAATGACFPPITVCMRTFFKQRLHEQTLLATAYSLESVLIELIFILGPVLVAVFVALASPAAAVLFAAACGCAGTLLFQRSRALRQWRIEARGRAGLFGPLGEPGFLPLLAVIVCYASAFGLVHQFPPAGACGTQFGRLGGQIGGGQPIWVHTSPVSTATPTC